MLPETYQAEVLPLKNKLYRYACRILGDEALAKDVAQETLMKVWEKRAELSGLKNTEAWCMAIARNLALDQLRSKRAKTEKMEWAGNEPDTRPPPDTKAELADAMSILHKMIERLPLKQREALQLRDIEGYSYQEISEITGCALSDVKVSIFRARKTIREKMEKIYAYGLEKSRSAD